MSDNDRALELARGREVSEGFGETSTRRQAEIAEGALMEMAKAEVQARYVMAERNQRDLDLFRSKLLKECKRPGFAAMAEYARPVGKEKNGEGEWVEKIARGPSIHMIRAALRLFKNTAEAAFVISNDEDQRIVRVAVSDIEANHHISIDITMRKVIERRAFKVKGKTVLPENILSERKNSYGDTVYLCRMTNDDERKEEARLRALAKRALGEELLPRDILQDGIAACRDTLVKEIEADPDAARKRILDSFAETHGVQPNQLAEYLGHSTSAISKAEQLDLRRVYVALNEGMTWSGIMESKDPVTGSLEDIEAVAMAKIAALRGNGYTTPQQGNGDSEGPSGTEKPEASTGQPATSATGTDGAPAPDKFITQEQVKELGEVFKAKNHSDEQIEDFIRKAGNADRIDHIPVALFPTILMMAKGTKGQGKK